MMINKILFNSVQSTPLERFMALDVKVFYLNTDMRSTEYMLVHRKMIPEEIIHKHKLHDRFNNDYILVEIRKRIYGLAQAGQFAYNK